MGKVKEYFLSQQYEPLSDEYYENAMSELFEDLDAQAEMAKQETIRLREENKELLKKLNKLEEELRKRDV